MKPVAIDLFCGLGGWAEGLLAEGYDVIGYDIEAHDYGTGGYPGTLILADVTTLHGSQFRDAALIVASPPCQAYSYRAMPWSRAKALPPPDNTLFETCFRIQREASEAAGRHIPMVVENVRGAQKWVGQAAWHYGSYFLWGDVPALMPITVRREVLKCPGESWSPSRPSYTKDHTWKGDEALKAPGKNWNEWKDWDGTEENKPASVRPWGDAAVKVGGIDFNGYGKPGYKAQAFNSTAQKRLREDNFGWGKDTPLRSNNSKSSSRKAASAMIAKIPFPLAQHIARTFYPI